MPGDPPAVWIVDDDDSLRRLVARWLTTAGHPVQEFPDARSCLVADRHPAPGLVLVDLHLPDGSGIDLLPHLCGDLRWPVVMLTADASVNRVVEAMRLGAHDYMTKPPSRSGLLDLVNKVLARAASPTTEQGHGIIGQSAAIQGLLESVRRMARSDATVLIQGESGTGKELVAKALHHQSGRASGPFVAVNSAAVPHNLQESEFFGHERGAFTGAADRRKGHFERAQGGTLFLDEVADLSPGLQAALLRVLQERRMQRVGGTEEIDLDVRVIAASHKDLAHQCETNTFRWDLYYRLAVLELGVPPLRQRPEDIGPIATSFATELGTEITPEAMARLRTFDWPGNVRELRNAIERAAVLADGAITPGDLPTRVHGKEGTPAPQGLRKATEDSERQVILDALDRANGNVSEVIRELDIPRTSLYRKLKKYGLR